MKNRGIGTVAATVLIVLITIVGATVFWVGILPVIQESISSFGDNVELSILVDEGYTVFDVAKHVASVQIKRGPDNTSLAGLNIIFEIDGESEAFKTRSVPTINEVKTYWFDFSNYDDLVDKIPQYVSVAPVFSEGEQDVVGEIADRVKIPLKEIFLDSEDLEDALDDPNKIVFRGNETENDTDDDTGDDTDDDTLITGDVVKIDSCQELQDIDNNLTASYELIGDVDCSGFDAVDGFGFNPIGDNAGEGFAGRLNGSGYKIIGLSINARREDNHNNAGLFDFVSNGGRIENVKLENPFIINGDHIIGLLVAVNYGTIKNCEIVNGQITGARVPVGYVREHLGGLVGENGGVIEDCEVSVSIDNFYSKYIGGVAGYNEGEIRDSSVDVNINAGTYSGGIVGKMYDGLIDNTNVDATSSISGDDYLGGVVGYMVGGSIINSYFLEGALLGSPGGMFLGRVAGYAGAGVDLTALINYGSVGDPVEICIGYDEDTSGSVDCVQS